MARQGDGPLSADGFDWMKGRSHLTDGQSACLVEVPLLRMLAVRPEPRVVGCHEAAVELAVSARLLLAEHLHADTELHCMSLLEN